MGESFTLKASHGADFKEYSVDQKVTSIGRSTDNAIVLDDAQISRHHAEVQFDEGVARITDLGSSNGTQVNGKSIEPNVPCELKEGDSISIGGYVLSVHSLPAAAGVVASAAEEKPVAAAAAKAKPPIKKPKWLRGKALAGIIAAVVLVGAVAAAVLFVPGGLRHMINEQSARDLLEKPGEVIEDLDLELDLDLKEVFEGINPLNEPPTISSFDASPSNIDPGDFAVLEWNVSGATDVSINHGIGGVNQSGSAEVSPQATETYTITATNDTGSVTREVTITVAGTSPPPDSTPSDSTPADSTPSGTTASDSPSSAPVIELFTASPATINEGDSSIVDWDVTGATSVSISPGAGSVPASGSATSTPPSTITYILTATNANGSVTESVTITVIPAPAPPPPTSVPVILGFVADPPSITAGGNSMLMWNVTGATSIHINNGVGQIPFSAGYIVVFPVSTTTYTLTATNAAGSVTGQATVTVSSAPPPSLPVINSFTATPSSISPGGSSTLSWSTTGATSASITPGAPSVPPSSSATATPAATTTYTLTATNAAGSVTKKVKVTVGSAPPPPSPPVITSFTASPSSISSGDSSTLSWSTTGATSVSIAPGIGSVSASGSVSRSPASTTTYTLTATNADGSVTRQVTVTVSSSPPPPGDTATCEQALFDAVNAVRASNGRPPLTRNAYIDGLCRDHAAYMEAAGSLSHDNFSTRADAIATHIPGMMACAENVLFNFTPCDATAMAQQWYDSSGHRDNMLNPAYTIAGMGIVIDGTGKIWACQIFAGP